MNAKVSLVIVFGAFAAAFGWQMALFVPPDEYQFAGWIVAGVCSLATGFAAARGA